MQPTTTNPYAPSNETDWYRKDQRGPASFGPPQKNNSVVADSASGSAEPLCLAKGRSGTNHTKGGRRVQADPDRMVEKIRQSHAAGGITRLLKDINYDQISTQRLTYIGTSLSSNVLGAFPPGAIIESTQVRTLTSEFTSFNLRFDLYRVIAIRLSFQPKLLVNTTAITPVSGFIVSQFSEGQSATTQAQVLSANGAQLRPQNRPWHYDAVPSNNTDAWLWTGTNSNVSATSAYGIQICTPQGGEGSMSTVAGTYLVEFVCQFARRD